jgi:hypothetical protein
LLDPGALSAFQDRDGTLWIGTGPGVSRVEIASPVSIFSRNGPLDATRFRGSVYVADGGVFGVGLYRPEKRLIEYSLAIENGRRYAPYTRSTDDKNQFPVLCIDHRQPILINDVETESSRYISEYRHTGGTLDDGSAAQPPVSMIYLPLVAQERVLGVLSVQSFKKMPIPSRT